MISVNEVQQEIVEFLKAEPTLITIVGEEIREAEWQGTEFSYPALRVRMGDMMPLMRGSCPFTHGIQPFTLLIFSEDASSREANDIAGLVARLTVDQQLRNENWISGPTRYRAPGVTGAIRTANRLWRTEVHLEANVYQTS